MVQTALKILEDIFSKQITVLNIAVPIKPASPDSAKDICLKHNFDLHLVEKDSQGNLQVFDLKSDSFRALHDSEVISESTPILEVLEELCETDYLFVKEKRSITHIVTRSDLDKIPIRIWLYGMVNLFEIGLKERIVQLNIKWEDLLSEQRIKKTRDLFNLKKERNEEIDLLGCTHLIDLGTIVFKSWDVFKDIFPEISSKKKVKSTFIKINELRDTLAHGQKIIIEWPKILKLITTISQAIKGN